MKKILFICKASVKDGLGHLFRSKSLALTINATSLHTNIRFVLIGDEKLQHHLDTLPFDAMLVSQDSEIDLNDTYDRSFIDLLEINPAIFKQLKKVSNRVISLSPIFNMLDQVDTLVHRTKYLPPQSKIGEIEILSGLEYSIIRNGCIRIPTEIFKQNLKSSTFHIAISMGGTDAANKTLRVLQEIKKTKAPLLVWVILGEGYSHSYKMLVDEIISDSVHEIVLVRSNRSIWQVLKNCNLAILAGGITSYEAAFCGLPTVNFISERERHFLVQELEERKLAFPALFSMNPIAETLTKITSNKEELIEMHHNSKIIFEDKVQNWINHLI